MGLCGLLVGELSGVAMVYNKVPAGIIYSIALNLFVCFVVAGFQHIRQAGQSCANVKDYFGWKVSERAEPVTSYWFIFVIAIIVPWFAIPWWRKSGTVDPLLSGSPEWAVISLMVLLLSHVIIAAILVFNWNAQPSAAELASRK